MDHIAVLKSLPSVNEIEAKLRMGGALLANSEAAKVLDRYRAARASLARVAAANAAAAFGVAMAEASDIPPADAARVAKECAAYLTALI
jgi:hypothetical protein